MIHLDSINIEPGSAQQAPFSEVTFSRGINIIIGEKSADSQKMNGVGKSVLIELMDYCLLADYSNGRIEKIPNFVLDKESLIIAKFTYSSGSEVKQITLKRGIAEKCNEVYITVGEDEEIKFTSINESRKYFERFFIAGRNPYTPTLRGMLSILVRKEDGLYNDVFYPTAVSKLSKFIDNAKPHLYFFGVNLSLVDELKHEISKLKQAEDTIKAVESNLKQLNIPVKELKSYIYDLESQTENLDLSVEALKPAGASLVKKQELTNYLVELDKLTTKRASVEYELRQLDAIPKGRKLNTKSLKEVYNYYSQGLGDMLHASFEDVQAFRSKIEFFQNELAMAKQEELKKDIRLFSEEIDILDEKISKIYQTTDAKRKIDDLADAVTKLKESNEKLDKLRGFHEIHEEKADELRRTREEVDGVLRKIDNSIKKLSTTVNDFEGDLRKMHKFIAGNERCQFELSVDFEKPKTKFIDLNYRIKLDGSSGINRIKTFIYDVLLMTSKHTSIRHPNILVHDNIFASSGRDDMVKSLNYLYKLEQSNPDFQYIVTINRDEFSAVEDEFDFSVTEKVKKTLTRDFQLFGMEYSERTLSKD